MNVTIFHSVRNPLKGKVKTLEDVLDSIKTGGKLKEQLIALRDSENYKSEKQKLPVICFNGEFEKRTIDGLKVHNGLMILDIDNIDNPEARKEELKESPYIYAVFFSPSYKGLKALLRIPKVKNDSEFKEYFYAAQEEFRDLDKSGKDISRACFFSYDPDIHINPEAEPFTKKSKEPKSEPLRATEHVFGQTDYKILDRVVNMVRGSSEGERHDALLKASRLAGGYIAGGKLDQYDAEKTLLQVFSERSFDRSYNPEKTIKDGLKYGLANPIDEPEYFTPTQKAKHKEPKRKDYGDFYVPFDDYTHAADDLFKNGRAKGEESCFTNARKYISFKTGFTTYIYSAPDNGKTQYCLSELVYQAERYGKKIAVYSKEIGEPQDVFAEVASTYIGKLFIHEDPQLVMTKEDKDKAKAFFRKHFYVIDPLYKGKDLAVAINDVLETVKHIEKIEKVHIDMIYIDPLSELEDESHLHNGRDDKWIHIALTAINNDARVNCRHNILITHVRDQRPILDKNSGMTYFPVPTPRELAGGQMWYRKGFQMICVHRPPSFLKDPTTGEMYRKNEAHVFIQKSKPKGVGQKGMFKIYWWKQFNRFSTNPDGTDSLEDTVQEQIINPQPVLASSDNQSWLNNDEDADDELPF